MKNVQNYVHFFWKFVYIKYIKCIKLYTFLKKIVYVEYKHWHDLFLPFKGAIIKQIKLRARLVGGVEKWEDRKYLIFPHVCLVGGMEKWKDEKLFCLVERKNERMKNEVSINLQLCPH